MGEMNFYKTAEQKALDKRLRYINHLKEKFMKKTIIIALIAILALSAIASAIALNDNNETEISSEAEAVQEVYPVSGEITEISEEYLLIRTDEGGMIQANINEETVMEMEGEPAVGDYVHVDYDGKMTRSIPAQISAQVIRRHILEGEIVETLPDENAFLLETETHNQVMVRFPENYEGKINTGDTVKVYYNGVMTMSLPGQINADKIIETK